MGSTLKSLWMSSIAALTAFMIVELVINVYRLSRLFALELTYTLLFIGIINGVLLIGTAVYLYRILNYTTNAWLTTALALMLFYTLLQLFTYFWPLHHAEALFPIFNVFIYGFIAVYFLALFGMLSFLKRQQLA